MRREQEGGTYIEGDLLAESKLRVGDVDFEPPLSELDDPGLGEKNVSRSSREEASERDEGLVLPPWKEREQGSVFGRSSLKPNRGLKASNVEG